MDEHDYDRCRFCAVPEPDRVLCETPNFYVMLSLGPLVEGHLMTIARQHISCSADIKPDWQTEFDTLNRAVAVVQREQYGSSLYFEHGRSGGCLPPGHGEDHCHHAHLHHVPVPFGIHEDVERDYRCERVADWTEVRRHYAEVGQPYLLVQHSGGMLMADTPERLPRHYLRSVVATRLGIPELADWTAFPSYDVIEHAKVRLGRAVQEQYDRSSG